MAQIDASIPLNVRPFQMPDQMNALAKVMQLKGLQQEQAMGQMKMEQYKTEREDQNALRQALSTPGADPYNVLLGRGKIKDAMEWRKGEADSKKSAVEAEKNALEVNLKKIGLGAQILSTAKDQASYDAARMTAQANGLDVSRMPPQFDPNFVQARLTESLSMKDQLEQKWKAMEYTTPKADAVLQANTSTANNQRSVGASYANAAATREIANATRDAARMQKGFESEQGLRKEFEALPEVKNYKQALPSYKGIEDAVKRNTTQADINIVYGIAKLYDPTSVVREGEYATVANSPNIPERIKGYAQYLAGGGRLTPKVKQEILAEARSRMKSYEDQHTEARSNFESIAGRTGVDPTRVFPTPSKPAITPSPAGGLSAEEQKELDSLRKRFGK